MGWGILVSVATLLSGKNPRPRRTPSRLTVREGYRGSTALAWTLRTCAALTAHCMYVCMLHCNTRTFGTCTQLQSDTRARVLCTVRWGRSRLCGVFGNRYVIYIYILLAIRVHSPYSELGQRIGRLLGRPAQVRLFNAWHTGIILMPNTHDVSSIVHIGRLLFSLFSWPSG